MLVTGSGARGSRLDGLLLLVDVLAGVRYLGEKLLLPVKLTLWVIINNECIGLCRLKSGFSTELVDYLSHVSSETNQR